MSLEVSYIQTTKIFTRVLREAGITLTAARMTLGSMSVCISAGSSSVRGGEVFGPILAAWELAQYKYRYKSTHNVLSLRAYQTPVPFSQMIILSLFTLVGRFVF